MFVKEGCGHVYHGYCLFQMFGGCNCEFTIAQMKSILGNRVGKAKVTMNGFAGCAHNCNKNKRAQNGNGFYTYLRFD